MRHAVGSNDVIKRMIFYDCGSRHNEWLLGRPAALK
jgi:hypothetical protein